MKPFLTSLFKRRWVRITCWILGITFLIIVLVLSWLVYELSKLGGLEESSAFADYVVRVYIPAERKKSGKWPTTLDGLSGYFKSHKDSTPMYDYGLDYYKQKKQFCSIEVLKITRVEFWYRLHTDDWTPICRSTPHPNEDEDACWDDTPEMEKFMNDSSRENSG